MISKLDCGGAASGSKPVSGKSISEIAREVIAAAGPNALRLNSGRYQSDAATNGQLEQNVHIEANFPNVESASEIEEAINNLVNLAAQRANYKNR